MNDTITVTTKRDLNWGVKNPKPGVEPVTIKAGESITLHFDPANHQSVYVVHPSGRRLKLGLMNAHNYVTGIKPSPSMKTLEKWSNDGVAKTVTGHRTEPDGYGPDGSPSWLLVFGII
jgi:hypothetical protein